MTTIYLAKFKMPQGGVTRAYTDMAQASEAQVAAFGAGAQGVTVLPYELDITDERVAEFLFGLAAEDMATASAPPPEGVVTDDVEYVEADSDVPD